MIIGVPDALQVNENPEIWGNRPLPQLEFPVKSLD
jgi:hypothetical protein